MNNQYMPKYLKVKKITKPDGSTCYLEKDHINAVEDTLLYEDTAIGNKTENSGTDLLQILKDIADGSASTECKISTISKNGTQLEIDAQKNVNIEVPVNLSDLTDDSNHRTVTDAEKTSYVNKIEKITFNSSEVTPTGTDKNVSISESDPVFSAWKNGTEITLGQSTQSETNGISVGVNSTSKVSGVSVGNHAVSNGNSISVGTDTTSEGGGISIGQNAIAKAEKAVQICAGTNETANTLKYRDTVIVDADGKIPVTESDPVFTTWKNGEALVAGSGASGANGCVSFGINSASEDWGTSIGAGSFSRCGLALGPDSKAGNSGDTQNIAAVAVGRYATATSKCSIAIGGGHDSSNTVIANAEGAAQIGVGTNSDANTLQFRNTKIVNSSGKIPTSSLELDVTTKVDKTQTIAGIDLQDNITTSELKNALGVTTSPTEATEDEISTGTETTKYISPNRNKNAVKTGVIKNADDMSLDSANQKKVQTWLGTNQLTFTFSDNTTRTFNFVCNEVL